MSCINHFFLHVLISLSFFIYLISIVLPKSVIEYITGSLLTFSTKPSFTSFLIAPDTVLEEINNP